MKKSILFPIFGLTTGLIIGFLLLEFFVRILCWFGLRPGYTVFENVSEYPRYVWSQFTAPTLPREEKNYNFHGNRLKINSHGYRGPLVSSKKAPGISRIIFLGGSHTFDLQAKEGKDWPNLTGIILKEAGYSVEVFNAAIAGHRSWDSLGKLYSELYMWQPDIVVFDESWNDIKYFQDLSPENSLMAQNLHAKHPFSPDHPESFLKWPDYLLGWSWAYSKIRSQYYQIRYKPEGKPKTSQEGLKNTFSTWGPKQYALHIDLMYHLCQRIGAKFVVIKQPRLLSFNNSSEDRKTISYQMAGLEHSTLVKAFEACDEEIEKLGELYPNLLIIDASSSMTGQKKYFLDHIHTTELGSEKLASITAEKIASLLQKS